MKSLPFSLLGVALMLSWLVCSQQGATGSLEGTIAVLNTALAVAEATSAAHPPPMRGTSTAVMPSQPAWLATPALAPPAYTAALEDPCQFDRWIIIPTGLVEYRTGDGWKSVIIEMAIQNNSTVWGSLNSWGDAALDTEGGFSYTAAAAGYLTFPDQPLTRYSAGHFLSDLGRNYLFIRRHVPRGVAVKGENRAHLRYTRILNSVFQVADTQHQDTLCIPNLTTSCLLPSGEGTCQSPAEYTVEIVPPFSRLVHPTLSPGVDYTDITGTSIDLLGLGTLRLSSVERAQTHWGQGEAVFLYFTFTHASQGYEASGAISGYVMGNDGILRDPGCPSGTCSDPAGRLAEGYFSAGPGQTTEGVLGILVPPDVDDLYFVLV